MESRHPSFDELEESGLIERGWVPEDFPRSATEIREAHDLDTNQVWIRFEVDRSSPDFEQFLSTWRAVDRVGIESINAPIHLYWWSVPTRESRLEVFGRSDRGTDCLLVLVRESSVAHYYCSR
ncbi:MAG: hypothetical protein MPN21_13595 [Thermoanaerobaculia bacterium]|nr:hypothetical protein [Thermoanaerobaculia bacterium]